MPITAYPDDFQQMLAEARSRLEARLPQTPAFYLHLGGYFTPAADALFDSEPLQIPLHDLCPALPQTPTPDGAEPTFLHGLCREVPVLVLRGERRIAEGVPAWTALFPTALAAYAGVASHIFVDTGMSLHADLKAGHWAMLTDFINGYGFSPIDGLHHLAPQPFADMAQVFSQHQNSELLNGLAQFGDSPMLCTGIGIPGFHVCTPAEAKRHQADGADIVSHELVLHLMLAAAFGCRLSAMVLAAIQLLPARPTGALTRQDILATAEFCTPQLLAGLKAALADIHEAHRRGLAENTLPDADADHIIHQNIRKAAAPDRSSPLRAFLRRN